MVSNQQAGQSAAPYKNQATAAERAIGAMSNKGGETNVLPTHRPPTCFNRMGDVHGDSAPWLAGSWNKLMNAAGLFDIFFPSACRDTQHKCAMGVCYCRFDGCRLDGGCGAVGALWPATRQLMRTRSTRPGGGTGDRAGRGVGQTRQEKWPDATREHMTPDETYDAHNTPTQYNTLKRTTH